MREFGGFKGMQYFFSCELNVLVKIGIEYLDFSRASGVRFQFAFAHVAHYLGANCLPRIDESNSSTHNFCNGFFQNGIVGAAKNECVDSLRSYRAQIAMDHEIGKWILHPSFFNERDQERTGLLKYFCTWIEFMKGADVGPSVNSGSRSNDANTESL